MLRMTLLAAALLPLSGYAQDPATGATESAADAAARASQLRESGQLVEALAAYEAVLAREPGNEAAYRAYVLTLADLGNSTLALEKMRARRAWFPRHEQERIEGDHLARGIAWGPAEPVDPSKPLAESEQALATLRQLEANDPRQTNWERTRLRVDALSALNHLQRHQEVVDGYQALLDEGIEVPA